MMNERIDELAFQSGITQHSYSNPKHPDLDGFIVSQEKLDKFAELILADYAKQLVQDNMSNHWYVQSMDEHYEQKWAHRFG
jgi:hypothetical protein